MEESKDLIISLSPKACKEINLFSEKVLLTRGGRIGSGMGLLIEALWGYYLNIELKTHKIELGWFPDHQYNDFVCLFKDQTWEPETRKGEALRIEVKSMNVGADESKAHFDVLEKETNEKDLLLVIIWEWKKIDEKHFAPIIIDHFIDTAKTIIFLRDQLHIKRGGSFVNKSNCPDGCKPEECPHDGEPLNASGKRERISGPKTRKPSETVSYAANFGGLIRMLKTSSPDALTTVKKIRKENEVAHKYISFIHEHFVEEELNLYPKRDLDKIANENGIETGARSKNEIHYEIRKTVKNYKDQLRNLD